MVELALQAVYKGFDTRLSAQNGVFDDRVRVSVAPPKNFPYPYVIQFWQGGGEVNEQLADDAEFLIGVKCVSTKFADAFRGASIIHERLNDKGEQDDPSDYVNGGDNWIIQTITAEETIYIVDDSADGDIVYHIGESYRVALVRRV